MVKYNSYKDIDAAGAAFRMALAPEKQHLLRLFCIRNLS